MRAELLTELDKSVIVSYSLGNVDVTYKTPEYSMMSKSM